ncbi:hypothetical protein HRU45_01165 [Candidatus Dependentiae bacterium]|nr:hypothetical protein [Candidatus Dependentiae bacterium]
MKNILRVLAYVFLSVQCANMFTLTTKDCDLSDEDVARLTRARDHKYAFVTPKLCNQLCLIYEKDAISRTAKWHLCSVVEEIKKGNCVVECTILCEAVRAALTCEPKNSVLLDYQQCLASGDACISLSPKSPENKVSRSLLCPTTIGACPTMPPTCVNNPK